MRYSIKPKEQRYVKGYGFFSFTKNLGKKYSKKLTDTAIKTGNDFATIAGKKIVHKSAEETGDLIGDKIADKITSASRKSHNDEIQSNKVNNEIPKERYISPKKRQKIIDELKLT